MCTNYDIQGKYTGVIYSTDFYFYHFIKFLIKNFWIVLGNGFYKGPNRKGNRWNSQ